MEHITPVYFDTNLYIYFFEDVKPWSDVVQKLFEERTEYSPLVASSLLLTELLVAPVKEHTDELVNLYSRLPLYIPHLSIHDFSQQLAIETAHLRAEYHLSVPDAIHIATAVANKATTFYTVDKRLPKIPQIDIVQL